MQGIIYRIFQGEVKVESQDIGPNEATSEEKGITLFDEDRGKAINFFVFNFSF